MEKIKYITDELNVKEICLSTIRVYIQDQTTIESIKNDIIITFRCDFFIDKIYGRKIGNKYYFARVERTSLELPDIDYYDEFFNTGNELQFT